MMRIGELAERTGASPRLLRYYEEQGLITPQRSDNGYRDYVESVVDRVLQVRGLLSSGLPTRVIRQILPCLVDPPGVLVPPQDASSELLAILEQERDRMARRAEFLIRNRDALDAYLTSARDVS